MNKNEKIHKGVFVSTKIVETYEDHFVEMLAKAFEKPHYIGMAMEAEHVLLDVLNVKPEEVQELHKKALIKQSQGIELLKDSINKGVQEQVNNNEETTEEQSNDH